MKRLTIETDFYILSCVYVIAAILFKWNISLRLEMLVFAIGAIIGLFLFDVLEIFIASPNPLGQNPQTMLKSFLTQAVVTIMALFVLTSTTSILGRGLVLILNFRLLYLQYHAFKKGLLAVWVGDAIDKTWYIRGLFAAFMLETALFIFV